MTTEIKVPDIGDFKEVPVIEILVKEGDAVNTDDPMISLESDKATMEVPAPTGGIIEKLLLKVGDKVSEGTPILLLKGGDGGMKQPPSLVHQQEPPPSPTVAAAAPAAPAPAGKVNGSGAPTDSSGIHASPSVRRIARELDVDLTKIMGTGEKGRITTDDVKAALAGGGSGQRPPSRRHGHRKFQLWIFPSSALSKPSRSAGSRKSPARICIAPGSTCRM